MHNNTNLIRITLQNKAMLTKGIALTLDDKTHYRNFRRCVGAITWLFKTALIKTGAIILVTKDDCLE